MTLLSTAVWWHVYPLAATGAPIHGRQVTVPGQEAPDAAPRLRHLEGWLDYAIELGCSGILLGPIFESASHGYDTLNHFSLDPRLGDDDDFDAFIGACQERGLVVMLDGVFNHVAPGNPAVEDGLTTGVGWEGHDNLVTLNHEDPRVVDLVTDVMSHWLRRGIAGWRLDVAYSVAPEFWREVLGRVRGEFPDAIFLGEVIHGDYVGIQQAGTLDTVTQYELWKGVWSSLKDVNFWELAHALERHAMFCESMVPNIFAGNHDVDRVASLVGKEKATIAAAIIFTLPGMPSIYYGDEQGFDGLRGTDEYADDAVRPKLPESPGDLLPYGWEIYREYQKLISVRRRHPWLSTAAIDVVDKANERITYSVTNQDNPDESIVVDVWLEPNMGVNVRRGDEVHYRWETEADPAEQDA